METQIKNILDQLLTYTITTDDALTKIKKLFTESQHPVHEYVGNKRAGEIAVDEHCVVGEIGCPHCGATMHGGFLKNKCDWCDQPYFNS